MINPNELARVKNIDLAGTIRSYGIKVDRRYGKFNCPFHDDKNASAKVYANNTFHCFGCGANGDVVDFVAKMNGCDFKTAFQLLGGDDTEPTEEEKKRLQKLQDERNARQEVGAWLQDEIDYYQRTVSAIEYQIRLLGLQDDDFDDWEWDALKRLSNQLTRAYRDLYVFTKLQKQFEGVKDAKHK